MANGYRRKVLRHYARRLGTRLWWFLRGYADPPRGMAEPHKIRATHNFIRPIKWPKP